jgi:hypothetical protein
VVYAPFHNERRRDRCRHRVVQRLVHLSTHPATTRNMIGRESGSSLTESIRKACDGISGHWALNRDLMHTGISAEKTTQKGGEISAILTGSVTGVVVDENGRPMSDATAYLESPLPKSATRPLHTGSDGRFFESNLAYGTYFLFCRKANRRIHGRPLQFVDTAIGFRESTCGCDCSIGCKSGDFVVVCNRRRKWSARGTGLRSGEFRVSARNYKNSRGQEVPDSLGQRIQTGGSCSRVRILALHNRHRLSPA